MANLEKANAVLLDLQAQSKEATERYFLLLGAVQGAEAILKAIKEVDGTNTVHKQRNRKRPAK